MVKQALLDVQRAAMLQYVLPECQIREESLQVCFELGRRRLVGVTWSLRSRFLGECDDRWHRLLIVNHNELSAGVSLILCDRMLEHTYLLNWLYKAPRPLAMSVARSLSIIHCSKVAEYAADSMRYKSPVLAKSPVLPS